MQKPLRRLVKKENNIQDSSHQTKTYSSISNEEMHQMEKIENLRSQTSRVIFQAKAFFPFDFFPDEIIIDEVKITVIHRFFFKTEQIQTIMIDEIQDVSVTTAIFIAKVYIKRIKPGMDLQPFSIGSLRVKDAKKIKQIILGLLITKSKKIDLSVIDISELSEKMQELGKSSDEFSK